MAKFNATPRREFLADEDWLIDKGEELWELPTGEHNDEVVRAVESLPEPYRSVLEMRFWGRMTYQQIAEEMGWKNRTWTSTYLRRAVERLRSALSSLPPSS